MTLPAKFVERVLRDLGGTEGAALCAALDAEPPVSVRLNPAKTGADTLPAGPDAGLPVPEAAGLPALAIAGRVPWSRDGRYLAVRPSFTLDPDFHAGAYYVQEASSQFVGHLLAAVRTEGARILDLCAAPGGKTTLYASLAGPDGLVVANEIDRRRASVLADNVRSGARATWPSRPASRVRWAISRRGSTWWPSMPPARARGCSARTPTPAANGAKAT